MLEVPQGRVLGLDLGDARIGLSISDRERVLAVPFGTVKTGAPQDLHAISEIVGENEVAEVVVGHPLSLSGEAGPKAKQTEAFADALGAVLHVPVTLHDERFSTVEAEKALAAAGARGRERRRSVDASAATVILQSYLDGLRRVSR